MQRRSFLQSIAAAFATPVLGSLLAPTVLPRRINYDLFTEGWMGHRYDLTEPFILDGLLFATDRRMVISHQSDEVDSSQSDRRFPDLKHIPFGCFNEIGWTPLRSSPVLVPYDNQTDTVCPVCFGTQRVGDIRRCPNAILFDHDDDCSIMGCEKCDGIGWIGGTACGHCKKGYIHSEVSEQVCGAKFLQSNMAKLRMLGTTEVRLFDFGNEKNQRPQAILGFRFDAGEHGEGRGFLMPLSEQT